MATPYQQDERSSCSESNHQQIEIQMNRHSQRTFLFRATEEHDTNEINCFEIIDAPAEPVTGLIIENAVIVDEVADDGEYFSTSIILPSFFIIIVVNAICLCTFYIFAKEMSLTGGAMDDTTLSTRGNAPTNETLNEISHEEIMAEETSFSSVIARVNISNENDLRNAASPQGRALAWITGEEEDMLLRGDRTLEEKIQRYVLVVLYYSFNGEEWTNQCLFLTKGMIECDWKKKVDKLSARPQCGITCDDNGLVQRISLEQNNLSGMIPTEIGYLKSIQYFSLWGNQINGSIPSSIIEMNMLEFISLSFNKLSGTIPPSLGDLASLVDVRLSNKNLTGVNDLCSHLENQDSKIEAVCDIEELPRIDPQCQELSSVTCCDIDEEQNKWRCCTTAINAAKKLFCYDPYDPFHMHFP